MIPPPGARPLSHSGFRIPGASRASTTGSIPSPPPTSGSVLSSSIHHGSPPSNLLSTTRCFSSFHSRLRVEEREEGKRGLTQEGGRGKMIHLSCLCRATLYSGGCRHT